MKPFPRILACAALAALSRLTLVAAAPEGGPPLQTAPAPAAPVYPLKAFSAIGSSFTVGNHLPELGWTDAQIEAFIDGVRASFHGKAFVFDDDAKEVSAVMGRKVEEIVARQAQQPQQAAPDPGPLKQYMKDICKRLNLEQSDSGLGYGIQAGGRGNRPSPDDTVVLTCMAIAADGTTKLPQLSYERRRLKVSGLLPGLAEGIQMMTNSSQAIFVLPPALSFGSGEWPEGVAPGSPLIFQVVLHEVVSTAPKG